MDTRLASTLSIWQVDAFTAVPFAGNPAAVTVLPAWPEDAWMQSVAAEMNLAETAFLVQQEDGWGLRWFTPLAEVKLCGHATLASAHVLWDTGRTSEPTLRFHTLSGVLTAEREDSRIVLDFPATRAEACGPPSGLLEALDPGGRLQAADIAPEFVGRNNFDYLVVLPGAAYVLALQPDFGRLASVEARGVIVSSLAEGHPNWTTDFVSRFFAPTVGVLEDPVTGSAHCALTPYWSARLRKATMVGYQASRRGGEVQVELRGDRVRLGGQAVTVLRGELLNL
jgi:PhzF family phenazine biosynthesis protein